MEIFCDVAGLRSFSQAARLHNVSQSSASQSVNMMEKQLGLQLIDRSKRPLELTPAGQIYLDGCREILETYEKTEHRLLDLNNRVIGRLRIAAIYSTGLLQMDTFINHYREHYPDVHLDLDYLHPEEVYERVATNKADLGLVSFPREGGDFTSIPWCEQDMVVVIPTNHKMRACDEIAIEELDRLNFVAFTPELRIRKTIDRWFKQAKIAVSVVHEFDNIEHIKRAVEIGSGVSILPGPTVSREVEIGVLKTVKIAGEGWIRPLGVVHKRHKTISTAAEKFIELITADQGRIQNKIPTIG